MTQPRDPETCLGDILNAAKLTLVFIDGQDQGRFGSDLKTQAAVIRQLEIIGEAANNHAQEAVALMHGVTEDDLSCLTIRSARLVPLIAGDLT
jgi:uncharacterized protein with HEPN domain